MNLTGPDIARLAKERKVEPTHLAREFVQLEILRRFSASELRRIACFKGGTALHLVFNMERYSEDLDFSLTFPFSAQRILSMTKDILKTEDITDAVVKRNTVLVEMRQFFRPQNFRVKLEINTDDIVPAELKTMYSEYVPASFDLQIMRTDYLVAQKIRALLERKKGRDLYDFWFILRTKLPLEVPLISELTGLPQLEVIPRLEKHIVRLSEKQITSDLNPFVKPPLRKWIRDGLKKDVIQLLRSLSLKQRPID